MTMKDSSEGSEKKKEKNRGCQKQRKASNLKRTQGLKKKLQELTTLCGIEGFMILLPETQRGKGQCSSVEPITWPEDQGEVLGLVQRYNDIDSKKRRSHCSNMHKEVEREIWPQVGDSLDGLSLEQLKDLKLSIDSKISSVIDLMNGKQREVLEKGELQLSYV